MASKACLELGKCGCCRMVVVEGACARRQTRNALGLAVVNVTDHFIIHECWNNIGKSNVRGPDVKD